MKQFSPSTRPDAAFRFKMRRWLACLVSLLVLLREHGSLLPATLAGFAHFPIEELREVLFLLLWHAQEDALADTALRAVFYEWKACRAGSLPWLELVKSTSWLAASFLHFSREGAFSLRIHWNATMCSQRIQSLWGFPCTWGPLPSLPQWQRWFEDMAVLHSLPPCDVSAEAVIPAGDAVTSSAAEAVDIFNAPLSWDALATDEAVILVSFLFKRFAFFQPLKPRPRRSIPFQSLKPRPRRSIPAAASPKQR